MPRPPRALLLIAVAAAAFAWGAVAATFHVFPWRWIEGGSRRIAALFAAPAVPEGLWHAHADAGRDARPNDRDSQALANLPYLRGFNAAPEVESVTVYDREFAQDGLNLVVSGHAPQASLQDMRGNTIHTWYCDAERVWPGLVAGADRALRTFHPGHETFWRRAHVYPNGDLLAVFDGIGLLKLDRDSNLLWSYRAGCHHDIFVEPETGDIYTLNRTVRTEHDRLTLKGPILEDSIAVLGHDGAEKRVVSILSCILDSPFAPLLAYTPRQGDILHTNTIELMDGRFADRDAMYAKGNALISMPAINTIAVIDLQRETVVWALGGMWQFQHQPTVLDDGTILVFDNLGHTGRSRDVQIEPFPPRGGGQYGAEPGQEFGSFILGSSQRLKNGNTLITESTKGRAFEVTASGDIVWEYVNPERAGEHNQLIASLLEVVRIDRSYFAAEFAAAQNEYATGRRDLDLTELETLITLLRR